MEAKKKKKDGVSGSFRVGNKTLCCFKTKGMREKKCLVNIIALFIWLLTRYNA